jgi:hypothetical protein
VDRTRQSRTAILLRLSNLYFRREQLDHAIHALEIIETLRARRSQARDHAFAVTKRFRPRNRSHARLADRRVSR